MRDATAVMESYHKLLPGFQSTHPMRDATCLPGRGTDMARDFNPRIPCGMRLIQFFINRHDSKFQSTHPMRDATSYFEKNYSGATKFQSTHPMRDATSIPLRVRYPVSMISIHASHAGCDSWSCNGRYDHQYFNPRIPCGMRRMIR